MNAKQISDLSDRIFADLLDVRDTADIGVTVARRVTHLTDRQAVIVLGQVIGLFLLLTEQIRDNSTSGADVITEIRDGFVNHLVKGDFLTPGGR